jgi:branched-chain amino acid transport system substrate-binding protein
VSTMDRRGVLRLFGGLAAGGVAGGATGCTTQFTGPTMALPNGRRVSIGLIAPAVGAFAEIGADITKGFQLYLNDHDHLLGLYSVDLTVIDEGPPDRRSEVTKAAKSLFDHGVVAVAGVANPTALVAIVPVALRAMIPVLSANAAPASIGDADFIWRVSSVQGEAGEAAATFARDKGPRAYVMSDGTEVGRAEASGFTGAFTGQGGQIVGMYEGAGGFAGRIGDAGAANADVIFAAYTGDDASRLLTAYRAAEHAFQPPALVGPGSLTETVDLGKLSGRLPQVYTSMFYAPDLDNANNQRFVASYHNEHGVPPSSVAAAAYDAAGLLDRALRWVQDDATGIEINKALRSLGQIDSPRGTWTFNPGRTPQQTWYLRQLRLDGRVPSNMHDSDLAVLS